MSFFGRIFKDKIFRNFQTKMCRFFLQVMYILEYQNSLGQKLKYEDLVYIENLCVFCNFLLCDFLGLKCFDTPPEQRLTIPLDQNVLIILVSITYDWNIQTFWHRKLYMKTWYVNLPYPSFIEFLHLWWVVLFATVFFLA